MFPVAMPDVNSDGRFLLTEAMKGTQAPDNIDRVKPHHLSSRETTLENVQCFVVIFVPEGRNHYILIGDVEVGVGCRQPHVLIKQR